MRQWRNKLSADQLNAKHCIQSSGYANLTAMSTQERLIQEIRKQPEPLLRELWHYLKFLERQREEDQWGDVLPGREIEQEVLDTIDGHPAAV